MVKEYDRLSLDTTRFSRTLNSESYFQLLHGSRKLSLLNRIRENLTRVALFHQICTWHRACQILTCILRILAQHRYSSTNTRFLLYLSSSFKIKKVTLNDQLHLDKESQCQQSIFSQLSRTISINFRIRQRIVLNLLKNWTVELR